MLALTFTDQSQTLNSEFLRWLYQKTRWAKLAAHLGFISPQKDGSRRMACGREGGVFRLFAPHCRPVLSCVNWGWGACGLRKGGVFRLFAPHCRPVLSCVNWGWGACGLRKGGFSDYLPRTAALFCHVLTGAEGTCGLRKGGFSDYLPRTAALFCHVLTGAEGPVACGREGGVFRLFAPHCRPVLSCVNWGWGACGLRKGGFSDYLPRTAALFCHVLTGAEGLWLAEGRLFRLFAPHCRPVLSCVNWGWGACGLRKGGFSDYLPRTAALFCHVLTGAEGPVACGRELLQWFLLLWDSILIAAFLLFVVIGYQDN